MSYPLPQRLQELVKRAREIRSEADRYVADIAREEDMDDPEIRQLHSRVSEFADSIAEGIKQAEGRA